MPDTKAQLRCTFHETKGAGKVRRCRLKFDGEPCTNDAAYTVWAYDCEACQNHGFVMCAGHRMCIEHSAGMRAGIYKWGAHLPGGNADAAVVSL